MGKGFFENINDIVMVIHTISIVSCLFLFLKTWRYIVVLKSELVKLMEGVGDLNMVFVTNKKGSQHLIPPLNSSCLKEPFSVAIAPLFLTVQEIFLTIVLLSYDDRWS